VKNSDQLKKLENSLIERTKEIENGDITECNYESEKELFHQLKLSK
jgi:hypothetical protein